MSFRETSDRADTDLRGEIVGCATQRPSSPLACFAKPKSAILTVIGEEDAPWFEVTVDDLVRVEVVEAIATSAA